MLRSSKSAAKQKYEGTKRAARAQYEGTKQAARIKYERSMEAFLASTLVADGVYMTPYHPFFLATVGLALAGLHGALLGAGVGVTIREGISRLSRRRRLPPPACAPLVSVTLLCPTYRGRW